MYGITAWRDPTLVRLNNERFLVGVRVVLDSGLGGRETPRQELRASRPLFNNTAPIVLSGILSTRSNSKLQDLPHAGGLCSRLPLAKEHEVGK